MRLYHRSSTRASLSDGRRPGAIIIELGLTLPVLLLIIVGVVTFGQLFFASITLSNAAEAGALYGAQSNAHTLDAAGIRNAALQDAKSMTGVTVTSTRVCKCPPVTGTTETTVNCITGSCGSYGVPRVYSQVTANATVPLMFSTSFTESLAAMTRMSTFRTQ